MFACHTAEWVWAVPPRLLVAAASHSSLHRRRPARPSSRPARYSSARAAHASALPSRSESGCAAQCNCWPGRHCVKGHRHPRHGRPWRARPALRLLQPSVRVLGRTLCSSRTGGGSATPPARAVCARRWRRRWHAAAAALLRQARSSRLRSMMDHAARLHARPGLAGAKRACPTRASGKPAQAG
jgi:hypothetical protein